jgi:hypothetical protein
MRYLAVVALLVACGGGASPVIDAATGGDEDAETVPGLHEFAPVPATMTLGCGELPYGVLVEVDDCVECMCTTYGGRCQRRAGCARDVCVFVDGTVIARGETAAVGCFDCACGDDGPSCARRTEPPCPDDGCRLPDGGELGLGQERFLSECHRCVCDETAGLLCENVCHPECTCEQPGCPERGRVPDQWLVTLDGAACVCDYSKLVCADQPG